MVEQFDSWVQALGSLGFLVFGLAAMIEYLFPPFPGDTILLLGGVYAVRGEKPWPLVLLAITLGSVAGAAVNYGVGRLIARRVESQPDGKLFFGLTHARIHQLQATMRKRGAWMIVLNRFLPAVRGILFLAAGAARMPVGPVLALGAVSALVWNVLILAIGLAVGGNAEKLERLVHTYHHVALAILAAVAAVLLGRFLFRLLRRPAQKKAAP